MTRGRQNEWRGIAEPVLVREPLLIRLCTAFVDNLTLLLKTAFVFGAVLLIQDLRTLLEDVSQPEPAPAVVVETQEIDDSEPRESMLTDSVKSALNCTYQDYRNAHYDECVKEPSRIYVRPQADPDDTGLVIREMPVMYARLENYAQQIEDNWSPPRER
jgi:hypothetical protein